MMLHEETVLRTAKELEKRLPEEILPQECEGCVDGEF